MLPYQLWSTNQSIPQSLAPTDTLVQSQPQGKMSFSTTWTKRQTSSYIDRQSYLRSTSQTQLSVISFTPCIHLPMWGQSKTVLSTGVASQLLNDYPACGKGGDNNRCDHTLCPANAKTAIGSVSCCIDLCVTECVCVCVCV